MSDDDDEGTVKDSNDTNKTWKNGDFLADELLSGTFMESSSSSTPQKPKDEFTLKEMLDKAVKLLRLLNLEKLGVFVKSNK